MKSRSLLALVLLAVAACRKDGPAAGPAQRPARTDEGFGRKNARTIELGTFDVTSDRLIAGDPGCPLDGEDAARTARPARRGSWKATVVRIDVDDWGTRNAELIVVHSEARGAPSWRRQPGTLGVDSGQVGVFDRPHYGDDTLVPKDHHWKDKPIDPKQPWYSLCCEQTLSQCGAGVVPFGAVSSSGIGDGGYDWFLWIERGELVGIKVLFLPE